MEVIKLSELALLTKSDAEKLRASIVDMVENGEVDALKIHMSIAFLNKVFEGDDKKNNGLKHLIKEKAITEFDRHGTKELAMAGFKIEKTEAGVQYDYSQDQQWNELKKQEEEIADKRKQREAFLKSLQKPMDILNKDTGELEKVYPPVKKSTTVLKFTIK